MPEVETDDTAEVVQECDAVKVGSIWRRNPPGREVVRVERVWHYFDELSVRAHPTTGGKPLVAPVSYLREHYAEEASDA
jgi:hypothetical protein